MTKRELIELLSSVPDNSPIEVSFGTDTDYMIDYIAVTTILGHDDKLPLVTIEVTDL